MNDDPLLFHRSAIASADCELLLLTLLEPKSGMEKAALRLSSWECRARAGISPISRKIETSVLYISAMRIRLSIKSPLVRPSHLCASRDQVLGHTVIREGKSSRGVPASARDALLPKLPVVTDLTEVAALPSSVGCVLTGRP